jgi:hypothetical protein
LKSRCGTRHGGQLSGIGGWQSKAGPLEQKHETLSEKQTKGKKGWGHGSSGRVNLPSKHKALNSSLSTNIAKRKKERKEHIVSLHLLKKYTNTYTE